ncbi:MAG: restriction endonuclease subunit R, partial [Chloroflexota bacterium]
GSDQTSAESVAETIENNVRSTIIKTHLNNPAYYNEMSQQLDKIIAERKSKALDYAAYLRWMEELAKQVHKGYKEDVPESLQGSPAIRAIYDNLNKAGTQVLRLAEERVVYEVGSPDVDNVGHDASEDVLITLAQQIDKTVKDASHDDWRGHPAREQTIKRKLHKLLGDKDLVEHIFLIIWEQKEAY